ncbi:MAG TPA: cysteine peptidase family C39 domain-containing protein, partial [Bdellovibrionales bacterium]|nr:cysteine peptidase family C39 domain-containing protein [Bdellovibrionales bacterium]
MRAGLQDFSRDPALPPRKAVSVRQHDQMDCGAACLATAALYYGRQISVAKYRSLVHVTRDGASMLSVKRAAEHTGFNAMGIYASYEALAGFQTPFIALMKYHFIVVFEVSAERVVVSDPARGLLTLTPDEFKRDWSQSALLLKPTPGLYEFPETKTSYREYLSLLNGSRLLLLEILLCSFLVFAAALMLPVFVQSAVDLMLVPGVAEFPKALGLFVLFLVLAASVGDWVRGYLIGHLSARLDVKFSSLFLKHALRLPLSFFAVRRVGDITSRMAEIQRVRDFFTGRSMLLFLNLISLVLYGGALVVYSPLVFAAVLALLPVLALYVYWTVPKLVKLLEAGFQELAKNQSATFELMAGAE